jgi:hypothetical protein
MVVFIYKIIVNWSMQRPQLQFNCPEKWNTMNPSREGRYCGKCEKVVTDFTGQSNEEILKSLRTNNKNNHSCGRFEVVQLEKPFGNWKDHLISFYQRISVSPASLRKTFLILFSSILLLVTGCRRTHLSGSYHVPTKKEKRQMERKKAAEAKDSEKKD